MRGQRVGKDFDFPPDIGALIESPGFLPNEDAYHTLAHLWSMRGKPDYVQIEKTLHMVGLSDVEKKESRKLFLRYAPAFRHSPGNHV